MRSFEERRFLSEPRVTALLFWLCWLTYTTAYLGRLNYIACMNEIMLIGWLTKEQAGLVAAGFFFSYGVGQLVSGSICNRVSPRIMVLCGLTVSALCNFFMPLSGGAYGMVFLWCVNGLAQSALWPMLIHVITLYYLPQYRVKAGFYIASSPIAGTLLAYCTSAFFVAFLGWKTAFYAGAISVATMGILFFAVLGRIERHRKLHGVFEQPEILKQPPKSPETVSARRVLLSSGMLLAAFSMVLQGMLKDSVAAWTPAYISETFQIASAASIISAALLPLCSLLGIFAIRRLYSRVSGSEATLSLLCFVFGACCFALLYLFPSGSMALSLTLLCGATAAMTAVNAVMTSVLPVNCAVTGKSAAISGFMNASGYMGSAVSNYGIGFLAAAFGWRSTIFFWCLCAALGIVTLSLASARWKTVK